MASNYLENAIANHFFRNSSQTSPTTVYAKLHTGDPGEDGTNNAAGESTRKSITFGAPSNGVISNTAAVTWTSVSTTETYNGVSIWDASSGGNCLGGSTLTASKAVTAGDDAEFAVGALTITVT